MAPYHGIDNQQNSLAEEALAIAKQLQTFHQKSNKSKSQIFQHVKTNLSKNMENQYGKRNTVFITHILACDRH